MCITDVRVSVSPATIELLNGVYSSMVTANTASEGGSVALQYYDDIWECKNFTEDDFWFLKAG